MLGAMKKVVALVAALPALASANKPPAPPAAATKPGENDLKALVGVWSCAGTSRGAAGAGVAYKARLALKWDLAQSWLAVRREIQAPTPLVVDGWLGWDAAGGRFWLIAVDSAGGWLDVGGASWSGPSLALTGAGSVDGKRTPLRYTFTRGKTERDLLVAVESQQPGSANWNLVAQDVCKR
jgi:hypothetical protein